MLNVKDVANRLALSPSKVYRLIEDREIAHHRIGGAIRVTEEQIAEYLAETKRQRQTVAPPCERPRPLKLKHLQL